LERNQPLPLGASLTLIAALVMSACGGSDVPQGASETTGLASDVRATAASEPDEDTTDASALDTERVQALAVAEAASTEGPEAPIAKLRTQNRFEKSEWDGESFDDLHNKLECASSISRSTDVSRSGESSIRFQTGLKDMKCPDGRYRSEVSVKTGNKSNQDYAWDDPDMNWVGLSIYPRKFDNPAYTFFQIHAPNEKGNCDYAGNAVTIKPMKIDGKMHYALNVILDGSKVKERNGAFSGSTRVWHEPMNMKGFTDFVVAFTLSTKKQGKVKLWRNGQLVYSASGLTNVNYIDSCGKPIPSEYRAHNGPHVGIYGPPAKGGEKEQKTYGDPYREIFVDQLRTATGPDGYGLVDPAR
jgi:hypothetical protein